MFKCTRGFIKFAILFISISVHSAAVGSNAILKALEDGDQPALDLAMDQQQANDVMRGLFVSLLKGDGDGVTRWSRECVDRASAHNAPQMAVFCNQIRANHHLARGDISSWAEAMRWTKAMSVAAKKPIGGIYDDLDYLEISANSPVEWRFNADSVPFDVPVTEEGPFVDVLVNGVEVRALVDTGLNFSVIISPRFAAKIGVENMISGLSLLPGDGSATPSKDNISLGEVAVGPVVARNIVIVETERFSSRNFDVVIGLPFLESIGTVKFTPVNWTGEDAQCRNAPIFRTTLPHGKQLLLFPAVVDGVSRMGLYDSGLMRSYRMQADASSSLKFKDLMSQIGTGYELSQVAESPVRLSVLSKDLGQVSGLHQVSPKLRNPLMLGAFFAGTGSVNIDFDRGVACIQ